MPPSKRQKLSSDDMPEEDDLGQSGADDEGNSVEGSGSGDDSDASPDTEDEIVGAKNVKSKKTMKRKRRATDSTNFGATLQSLLSTNAPSALPLSLKPSVTRKRKDEKLELKGKKLLQVEKKEKEDRGRITDVIGGWGGEGERALRKVAQRGVVKLFNVIQQSQTASSAAAEELKSHRGSGKPTLPAPIIDNKSKSKGKQGAHVTVKAKEAALGQDDFLDLIRSGGVVSKA
ncbi:hypothetical protein A0H81_00825 [Grifola frondosa]|uniref:Rrp15p-domain-containing protein n=1 Tax=Grifola frondosa TaxID=5627 RepID=A0A1C7MSS5_GRIFR|nr:hypothetical protein A0H81_00825 [Grifola frondosa]